MIPPAFQPASVRGITAACKETGDYGVSFNLPDGTVARYRVGRKDVEFLASVLEGYVELWPVQCCSSSGRPSSEGSPHDGHAVTPLASSHAASDGLEYAPSDSPSNMACQRPSRASRIQKNPARVSRLKAVTLCMALALSLGGWWYFHSRKVSSAAMAQEVAHG